MKICVNGVTRDMTAEETAEMEAMQANFERMERKRPLSAEEVYNMIVKAKINEVEVDDNTALRMREFYPEWEANTSYTPGFKVTYIGKLFKCIQEHTSIDGWQPGITTASLWAEICEEHDGSQYDPIPYDGNMALEDGKHYIQNDIIYLCTRNSDVPVYNALADLVGLYVVVK